MAGYPHNEQVYGSGYGSGYTPPRPYGYVPPSPPNPYGAPRPPYSAPPPGNPYGAYVSSYGDNIQPSAPPMYGDVMGGYGNPFSAVMPTGFAPGTDPNVIACFNLADQDRSGLIDDKELQMALSGYNQSFSLRTVRLLMYLFTKSNSRRIGPKEFTEVFYSLQNWRSVFERFDRDRSGRIDSNELRDALLNLGYAVSPVVLDLLVAKFDKSGGRTKAIEYDNFIECCLTVKELTEKFKERDRTHSGSAMFTYDDFMLSVLPVLIS